ncbi:sensor histidine kinase [Arenimonas terrae]|uniref:histidine kinase n=1 Tax=Arenimonas terrae TaxID=2546226 RepID=A0A5C4RPY6_9GAMM|nr:sensor histidine kinase [Arenimonas terrae]TNJ33108.1 HAMP domain-containing histidine kinase [Arenimonas terrae]
MIDRRSLRLRLLLAGGLGVLVASLAVALWLGQAFAEASERAFDRELADELQTLIVMGEVDEAGGFALQSEPEDQHYARLYSGHYWRVIAGDRQFQSRSLWDGSLDVALPTAPGRPQVREVRGPRDVELRALVQAVAYPGLDQPVVFLVAADRAELSAEAADFRLLAGGAVALVAVTLLALLALQVGFALRPLTRLADTAARVRRGESASFPTEGLPSEVAPLANHLNELLEHHDRSVQRARTAAQDLAHALKTPLAVLALEAERPGPQLAPRVQAEVARMRASVDRHLGRGIAADPRGRTPVAPVVDALLALMQRVHGARGLRFERVAGDDAVFAGGREDLEEMLGNLLDNAGKWAEAGVRVEVAADAGRLRIAVRDDGPGLPAEARDQVTRRGVRLDEQTPGSGLGLAIVQDIAGGYGGQLRLADGAPGLVATLDLPAG